MPCSYRCQRLNSPVLRPARFFLFTVLVVFSCYTHAFTDTIHGTVVNVHDGDTITVLDVEKKQHKIRLAGIDAPELGQAYGKASRKHLADMIAGGAVTVEWKKRDKYQRIVGKVTKAGKDICLAQIDAGMAWHYVKYQAEQSEADRAIYAITQTQAKEAKQGLWQDQEPMPPWEWRHNKTSDSDSTALASNACDLSQGDAIEHGGGLNACGCHFNRKTGGCHCHRPRSCGCSCQPSGCR